jgi:uncharacterized protein
LQTPEPRILVDRALVTLLLLVLSIALPGEAASFDCSGAATVVEKTICSEPALSELDDRLARLYKRAIGTAPSAASLRLAQRQWLEQRNRCAKADCIRRSYEQRIGQLSAADAMALTVDQAGSVCAALEKNKVAGEPFPHFHALLARPCWRPLPGLARIDLDNDGRAENLVRVSQCFRDCESVSLVVADDTRTRTTETPLNSALTSIAGGCGRLVDLFRYEGRVYVEASQDGGPRTVYQMIKDKPEPQRICTAAPWR